MYYTRLGNEFTSKLYGLDWNKIHDNWYIEKKKEEVKRSKSWMVYIWETEKPNMGNTTKQNGSISTSYYEWSCNCNIRYTHIVRCYIIGPRKIHTHNIYVYTLILILPLVVITGAHTRNNCNQRLYRVVETTVVMNKNGYAWIKCIFVSPMNWPLAVTTPHSLSLSFSWG